LTFIGDGDTNLQTLLNCERHRHLYSPFTLLETAKKVSIHPYSNEPVFNCKFVIDPTDQKSRRVICHPPSQPAICSLLGNKYYHLDDNNVANGVAFSPMRCIYKSLEWLLVLSAGILIGDSFKETKDDILEKMGFKSEELKKKLHGSNSVIAIGAAKILSIVGDDKSLDILKKAKVKDPLVLKAIDELEKIGGKKAYITFFSIIDNEEKIEIVDDLKVILEKANSRYWPDIVKEIDKFTNRKEDTLIWLEKTLRAKLNISEGDSFLRIAYALVLQSQHRVLDAKQAFKKVLDGDQFTENKRCENYDKARSLAAYELGLAAKKEGKLKIAAGFFKKAISFDKKFAKAKYYLGLCYEEQKKFRSALSLYTEVLSLDLIESDATFSLGRIYLIAQDSERAKSYLEAWIRFQNILVTHKVLTLPKETLASRKRSLAHGLETLGDLHEFQGYAKEAKRTYGKSLEIRESLGDKIKALYLGVKIAEISINLKPDSENSLDESAQYLEEILHELRNIRGVKEDEKDYIKALIYNNLIKVHGYKKNLEEAKKVYNNAMVLWEKLSKPEREIEAHRLMGKVYAKNERWEDAYILYDRGLQFPDDLNTRRKRGYLFLELGDYYLEHGDLDNAESYFDSAKALFKDSIGRGKNRFDDRYGIAVAMARKGRIYARKGNSQKAMDQYDEVLEIFKNIGSLKGQAQIYNQIGMLSEDQQEWDDALEMYQEGVTIHRHLENNKGERDLNIKIAKAFTNKGENEKAAKMLIKTLKQAEHAKDIEVLAKVHNGAELIKVDMLEKGVTGQVSAEMIPAIVYSPIDRYVSDSSNLVKFTAGGIKIHSPIEPKEEFSAHFMLMPGIKVNVQSTLQEIESENPALAAQTLVNLGQLSMQRDKKEDARAYFMRAASIFDKLALEDEFIKVQDLLKTIQKD